MLRSGQSECQDCVRKKLAGVTGLTQNAQAEDLWVDGLSRR